MQREVHILFVHGFNKQPDCTGHHKHIAGFDRNDHIIEVSLDHNPKKLHSTFHHPLGSVAIPAHDTVGKRTVVDTYADSCAVLPAQFDKRCQCLVDAHEFLGILLISVFKLLERASGIDEITRIDTDFFHPRCSGESRFRVEVYISHQRHVYPLLPDTPADLLKVDGFTLALSGQPDDVGPGGHNAEYLVHTAIRIHG